MTQQFHSREVENGSPKKTCTRLLITSFIITKNQKNSTNIRMDKEIVIFQFNIKNIAQQ
jgi:hypothetical protein